MLTTTLLDCEDRMLAGASALVEPLRAAAAAINDARAMPRDILDTLRDADLLSMVRPTRFGGAQASLKTVLKVSSELARGDASTAWVHSVFTGHDFLLGRFPAAAQEAFWSSALPLCASSLMPTGKAAAVDGGWELTGTWSFCSGIDHAGWTMVGAFTGMVPGEPRRPQRRLFLVPASAYAIVDDWQVMGLRGTGSKSIVLDRAFVPAEHAVLDDVIGLPIAQPADDDAPEAAYSAWPLMSFALVGLAASIARNAYEHAVAEINAGAGKPNPLFDSRRPAAALHLAESSAEIDAADLLYTRALDETFAIVDAGEELTIDRRVRNRRDQCFAAKLAHGAAARLLGIGGARGIREGGVVQRAYRDLCALTLHPASNWDATALSFGTVAMGGAPTEMIV